MKVTLFNVIDTVLLLGYRSTKHNYYNYCIPKLVMQFHFHKLHLFELLLLTPLP